MPTPEATQLAEEVFYMDTPEDVALALDRFAAQHGAEAQPLDVKLRAAQQARSVLERFRNPFRLLTNTEWEDLQTAIAKAIASGAQTGGDDAEERARAIADLFGMTDADRHPDDMAKAADIIRSSRSR